MVIEGVLPPLARGAAHDGIATWYLQRVAAFAGNGSETGIPEKGC